MLQSRGTEPGRPQPTEGRNTKAFTISLPKEPVAFILARERELNVGRSVIFQTYIGLDQRDNILARELARRLREILENKRKARRHAKA